MFPPSAPFRVQEETGRAKHYGYSRKQKSLGLLCTKFLSLYNKDGVDAISLDEAASLLGVERRRIYDIVNVLESVGVLARKAKNTYSWFGFSGIPKMLQDLKEEGLRQISDNPGDNPFANCRFVDDEDDDKEIDQDWDSQDGGSISLISGSPTSTNPMKNKSGIENRRDKSLGQLTQNVVKLFLTFKADTITLDEAARLLLCDGHDANQMRTKVRRLYDIANVLTSLNLIEKTHSTVRKPAFRWLGASGKRNNRNCSTAVTIATPPDTKQSDKRAFGNDITNLENKRSKLSTAVDKPRMVAARSDDIMECNQTAQRQLQGSNTFNFGPFQPVTELKKRSREEREEIGLEDWDTLASTFQIQYRNEALNDLFSHYKDAWKSWYGEVAHGRNLLGSHHSMSNQPY